MDMISRETVANELEKHQYSREFCIEHRIDFAIDMGMVRIIVNSIPSAFEGMTNGEVMQAVFPNCYMGIDDDEWIVTNIDGRTMFQPEWWNAPYKAESEG